MVVDWVKVTSLWAGAFPSKVTLSSPHSQRIFLAKGCGTLNLGLKHAGMKEMVSAGYFYTSFWFLRGQASNGQEVASPDW